MADSSRSDEADRPAKSAGSPATRAAAIDVIANVPAAPADRATALAALREAALRAAGVLPEPAVPEGQQARFWLRRSDQLFVAVLLMMATGLMLVHWVRLSDWGRQPVEIDRLPASTYEYRIDINRATWVEWSPLEGIGETLARRIVEDRERNGPFSSVDDLLRVRGIGPVKLEAMRPHLEIHEAESK